MKGLAVAPPGIACIIGVSTSKKQLPVNYDWCDSRGKGTYCYLSVLDTSDHAKWFKPLSEDMPDLSEYWEADEDVL